MLGRVTEDSGVRQRQGGTTPADSAPSSLPSATAPSATAPTGPHADLRAGNAEGWGWGDAEATIPPDATLPSLVSAATRVLGTFWWYTAQGTGISLAGLGVMRLLAARDGLKSSEVAARGWSTPGTVTSVVDTLVRDGYVERRRDPGDRRVVRLYLTDEGRRKMTESVSQVAPKWHGAFDYVDPADEPVIRKFLADTIEHFGKLIREERGK